MSAESLSSAPPATVDLRLCGDGTPTRANGHTSEVINPRNVVRGGDGGSGVPQAGNLGVALRP
ncbi:MAG: hypothetical protein QOI09_51 [Chloroflexota bacterium]|jgi:hypothetical protein|nr:hypothetical protein [Chloroflexota bacterium]